MSMGVLRHSPEVRLTFMYSVKQAIELKKYQSKPEEEQAVEAQKANRTGQGVELCYMLRLHQKQTSKINKSKLGGSFR